MMVRQRKGWRWRQIKGPVLRRRGRRKDVVEIIVASVGCDHPFNIWLANFCVFKYARYTREIHSGQAEESVDVYGPRKGAYKEREEASKERFRELCFKAGRVRVHAWDTGEVKLHLEWIIGYEGLLYSVADMRTQAGRPLLNGAQWRSRPGM